MPEPGAEPPLKPHRSILEAEIAQAEEELQRPAHGLLISGIVAGVAIGTSLFLMAVLLSGATADLPQAVVELLLANGFTVGFILVILSRVDLFTEYTTIAILPVLVGRTGHGQPGPLRLDRDVHHRPGRAAPRHHRRRRGRGRRVRGSGDHRRELPPFPDVDHPWATRWAESCSPCWCATAW